MEIKLTDNSKLVFTRIGSDLVVELHQPRNLKDGHGFLLMGTARLTGQDLTALRHALQKDHKTVVAEAVDMQNIRQAFPTNG